MLTKVTCDYADHEITLKCDVYEADNYDHSNPVFLFFHSGGLVGGSRDCIPPWLVQACFRRQWSLISPSYRLLPQVRGSGLVDDALGAYDFARSWKGNDTVPNRHVIVGGASAGFFMACLVAHYVEQVAAPKALFCITGIPSFRHPFFNSSVLVTPEPIRDDEVEAFITGPLLAGAIPDGEETFSLDCLLTSGLKNHAYTPLAKPTIENSSGALERWSLYDYYLFKNAYLDLIGDVDPGFEWAKHNPTSERLRNWPPTVFIQGDADPDVSLDVTTHAVGCLGPSKSTLCLAKDQRHLFEAAYYLDDEHEAMDVVRQALLCLDKYLSE